MKKIYTWSWAVAVAGLGSALLGACSPDEGQAEDRAPVVTPVAGAAAGVPAAGSGAGGTGLAGTTAQPAGTGAAGSLGSGLAGRGAAGAPPLAGMAAPPPAGRGGMMPPAAGSAARPMVTNPAECPPAPMDATPQAVMALAAVNNYRVPAGAGCATMISEINKAATNHCVYYNMYMMGDPCIANPHGEVMTCAGFTGASPGERMRAAGYTMSGGGEVMAFVNNPQNAVDTWVNSVWHRTPILDPWTTHLGYGSAMRCDTIDFGRGTTPAPNDAVVFYPYDGQINVPVAFNGQYEGPMPPAPPTGWPSSGPISIHAKGVMLTEHILTKDGDAAPIEHVWLDSKAEIVEMNMRRSLINVSFMYANMPFEPMTKYRVKVTGSYASGMIAKEWTFTTGAAGRRR